MGGSRVALLLALCTGVLLPAAAQDTLPRLLPLASSIEADTFSGNGTINVCTSDYAPIVYCLDREPPYGGYEMALFELVRQQLEWAPDRLNFSCLDWYEMIDHMEAGDGTCDIGVAGIDLSRTNLEKGITFTYPTLSSGYRILITSMTTSSVDYWVFLDAFEWQLWVAIVATSIAVGLILWGVTRWANVQTPPPNSPPYPDLQHLVFGSLGRPMQVFELDPRNFAGRFIVLFFSLLMLVLVSLYTAGTAANLTASQLKSNIRSVEDLPGKAVGTWMDSEYMSDLARRGIDATGYPWDTDEDLQNMVEALRRGEIQALVLDSYVLEYLASSQCDLTVLGGLWDEYDQAVAFPSNFENTSFLKEFNRALVTLKDTGQIENLERQYIKRPDATCKSLGVAEQTTQITFQEVSGLWILLAASVGVAGILVLVSQLALVWARRMSRTNAFRAGMHRLRHLSIRSTHSTGSGRGGSGNSHANGGGSGDARRGRAQTGGGASNGAAGEVSLAVGPSWRQSPTFKNEGSGHGTEEPEGSCAPAVASMSQVLAAVQRVEQLLHASQQQQPSLPQEPFSSSV